MKGKLIFSAVGIGVLLASGYLLLSPKKESYPDKAYSYLVSGNYCMAEEAVREGSEDFLFPLALYQGYIAQARSHFTESEYFFQCVLQDPPKSNQKEVLVEAYLAQMANAYLQKKDHLISPLLDSAKQFSSSNSILLFFDGLSSYLDSHYSDALRFWSAYPCPTQRQKQSGWMPFVVENFFPPTWRQLHIAHCLAEEGDLSTSRAIIEKEQHQLDNQNSDYHHLAALFLGLTYLKESADIAPTERASYYKLAQFYFNRAENLQSFYREQNQIIKHIQSEVEMLLANLLDQEKRELAFAFIRTLMDWKAHDAINQISNLIVTKMTKERDEKMSTFCHCVRNEFTNTPFYDCLTLKLREALAEEIKTGHMEQLAKLWELSEALSLEPASMAKEIAHLTQDEMFRTIYLDGDLLNKTRNYLLFWNQLKPDRQSYSQMSTDLFRQATLFWKKEGQERKGLHLMEIALQLSPEKKELEKAIESFLTVLYQTAESSNMVYRLGLVHDALMAFGMGVEQDLVDGSKLANHLADAEYLYYARNYAAAKTHAKWVLKHDRTNQKALRIVGLSNFQLGEYRAALNILDKLSIQDIAVQKAIAFSIAFASQEVHEHIVQIDNIDSFDADTVD